MLLQMVGVCSFIGGWYSTEYIYHIFFIHSSISEHLGCFHVLVIINNAAVIMGVQISHPEVQLLDHMIVLFSIFWGHSILFSIAAAPIYIPTNSVRMRFPFSPQPHQNLSSPVFFIFYDSHSDRCEVISPVVLTCISLMIYDAEHLSCELGI